MRIDAEKFRHCQSPMPVRHKRKVPFLPVVVAPPRLKERIQEVTRLDQELERHVLRQSDYFDLVADAYASNFHYSTKLEGNPLPLSEVRKITRNSLRGKKQKIGNGHRQEILNHLMIALSPDAWRLPWTIDEVQGVHRMLLDGVDEEARPGQFRDFRSAIEDEDGDDSFITAPPEHIAEELTSLVHWVNNQAPTLHPIVAGAILFHEFESIHPFADGNGRTGRVLLHGYLGEHGLSHAHLCMVEKEVTEDPELYYRVLAWTDHTGSYTELVDYFADAIQLSYRKAVRRFAEKDLLSSAMDETAKRIVVQAKRHSEWFKIEDAARWVDGRAEDTVRRHLNGLVREGVLETQGATKAKRYRYPSPFRDPEETVEGDEA